MSNPRNAGSLKSKTAQQILLSGAGEFIVLNEEFCVKVDGAGFSLQWRLTCGTKLNLSLRHVF